MSLPVTPYDKFGEPAEHCVLCSVSETLGNKSNCIPARKAAAHEALDHPVKYLLVGDAPADNEDADGICFTGASGELLDETLSMLTKYGLKLEQIGITNAIKCRLPRADDGSFRKPRLTWKRVCRRYLDEEIEATSPDVVIALGGQPLSAMLDQSSAAVGPNRLKKMEYEVNSKAYPLVVTYHPAAVLRDRTRTRDFVEDLHAYMVERVWEQEGPDESDVDVFLVQDEDAAEEVYWLLQSADVIGIDIETAGFSTKVLTVAVSFPEETGRKSAWVLPVYHPEGLLNPTDVLRVLREDVLSRECLLVGQHVKYDIGRLVRATRMAGAPKCLADDSMVYHYMLDEVAGTRTLDYFSRRYTKLGGYKEDIDKGNLINEDLAKVARYNGTDAVVPVHVIDKLKVELDHYQCFSPQLVELYRRMTPFVAMLEANGMAVDLTALSRADRSHSARVGHLKKKLRQHVPEHVNLGSPKQLSEFIYDELGIPVPKVKGAITASGQRSTKKEVIEALAGEHPFIDDLVAHRHAEKMRSTYVAGTAKAVETDGRVYPDWFMVKTVFGSAAASDEAGTGGTPTGRLSAKKPPVQNIPKDDPVRDAYISRHGKQGELLDMDASQMELRYAGWWSGDPNIRAACVGDPHQGTADLLGISRDLAKRVNFGSIYGASVAKLIEIGVEPDDARMVVPKLQKDWRIMYNAFAEVEREAIALGQVHTPYGAYRRVPGANQFGGDGLRLLRQAVNFMIQCPASHLNQLLAWRVMVEADRLAAVVCSKHDALTLDYKGKDRKKVVRVLRYCVEEKWKQDVRDVLGMDLDFPFQFEAAAGKTWGKLKPLEIFRC